MSEIWTLNNAHTPTEPIPWIAGINTLIGWTTGTYSGTVVVVDSDNLAFTDTTFATQNVVWATDGTYIGGSSVAFDTSPTGDLLAWLQNYATKQVITVSVDMTTLGSWSTVAAGSHTLQIKAKATNYRDSDLSTSVSFTKYKESYTITPTLTNITADSSNPTVVTRAGETVLKYTADGVNYKLPTTKPTIKNVTSEYNRISDTECTITLTKPTNNVTFSFYARPIALVSGIFQNCTLNGKTSYYKQMTYDESDTITIAITHADYVLPASITTNKCTATYTRNSDTEATLVISKASYSETATSNFIVIPVLRSQYYSGITDLTDTKWYSGSRWYVINDGGTYYANLTADYVSPQNGYVKQDSYTKKAKTASSIHIKEVLTYTPYDTYAYFGNEIGHNYSTSSWPSYVSINGGKGYVGTDENTISQSPLLTIGSGSSVTSTDFITFLKKSARYFTGFYITEDIKHGTPADTNINIIDAGGTVTLTYDFDGVNYVAPYSAAMNLTGALGYTFTRISDTRCQITLTNIWNDVTLAVRGLPVALLSITTLVNTKWSFLDGSYDARILKDKLGTAAPWTTVGKSFSLTGTYGSWSLYGLSYREYIDSSYSLNWGNQIIISHSAGTPSSWAATNFSENLDKHITAIPYDGITITGGAGATDSDLITWFIQNLTFKGFVE